MTRSRLCVLLVAFLLGPATFAAVPVSSGASAPPECRWGARGLVENRWLGGTGSWSDVTKWSRGVVPGRAARDYACIPQGSDVVVDTLTSRIDLDVLELGRGSSLTLQPGTALYVWGDQDQVRSITKRDSVIEVDGATLGGGGRLHVIGTVNIHRSSTGGEATLTTRPEVSSYSGPAGILEIGDEGTLDVRGSGSVRLATEYIVDVHGRARLRDDAGLVADHGTTFLLKKHYYGGGVGRLVLLNDHGFAEGDASGIEELATFVNRGRIVKRESNGTSRIEARYVEGGEIREQSGHVGCRRPSSRSRPLRTPVPPGPATPCRRPACGRRRPTPTAPATSSSNLSRARRTRRDRCADEGARPRSRRDARRPRDHPTSLRPHPVRAGGHPGKPGRARDRARQRAGRGVRPIPSCVGRTLRLGAAACFDVAASTKNGDDLVLVIRTTDTSRWIAY